MIPVLLAPRPASSYDPQSAPIPPADQGEGASEFDAAMEAEAEGPPDESLWPAGGPPKEGGDLRQGRDAGLTGEGVAEGAVIAASADLPPQVTGLLMQLDQAMNVASDAEATAEVTAVAPLAASSPEMRAPQAGMLDTTVGNLVSGLAQPGAQPVLPGEAAQLPAPEVAMVPERALPTDRTAGPQAPSLLRAESAAPLPQGYDFSTSDQLMLSADFSREPLAKPLQSGAVEGAIRFALAASDTPEAQMSLPPPVAAAEVNPADPRRRQVEQAPPPEDGAFALEEYGAKTPRLAPETTALRPALPGPMRQDPAILPAADESALQDLSAFADSEALPSLSDAMRNQARSLSMAGSPGSPASLPASLPSTILGVVLSPVPGGVELALSPAELGQLRIEVTPDGDTLRILLSAERPETLELLRRHADQLMVEVLQAGFSGAAMSFGTWGGQSGGEGSSSSSPSLPTESDARPDVTAAFAHLPHLPAHEGGLNLRL